ncbi:MULTISPECIES: ferredoxin [unclassified Pseudofrankia]|uniref:ferredoxin n=1 Tax=unclassified Pseudofrankia TaxID=2994372 RepID=UPI0008D9914C|nr:MULTISPECIES: ferredoxin [unclassified Pseudofrankia]MDT3446636.1 ferredoxin [Pseudofrankia sp. BMG5.37]OHV58638.1 ferredoxin [Pseudofrankia sp. BMG5.36]
MKLVVDRGRCTGIGICESIAPDVFEVGDDGVLVVHSEDFDGNEQVAEAVRSCPAMALSIAEDG